MVQLDATCSGLASEAHGEVGLLIEAWQAVVQESQTRRARVQRASWVDFVSATGQLEQNG